MTGGKSYILHLHSKSLTVSQDRNNRYTYRYIPQQLRGDEEIDSLFSGPFLCSIFFLSYSLGSFLRIDRFSGFTQREHRYTLVVVFF